MRFLIEWIWRPQENQNNIKYQIWLFIYHAVSWMIHRIGPFSLHPWKRKIRDFFRLIWTKFSELNLSSLETRSKKMREKKIAEIETDLWHRPKLTLFLSQLFFQTKKFMALCVIFHTHSISLLSLVWNKHRRCSLSACACFFFR